MLSIRIEETPGFRIAHLDGEFTASSSEAAAGDLHEQVGQAGAKLAIDLSKVTVLDSTGLSILMNVVSRARLAAGQVVLVAPTPFVRSVFAVTKLDGWFEICDALDQARARLD